jgi:hypothetical protein
MWYDYKDDMDWEEFINPCVEEDANELEWLEQNEPSPEELAQMNENAEMLLMDIEEK